MLLGPTNTVSGRRSILLFTQWGPKFSVEIRTFGCVEILCLRRLGVPVCCSLSETPILNQIFDGNTFTFCIRRQKLIADGEKTSTARLHTPRRARYTFQPTPTNYRKCGHADRIAGRPISNTANVPNNGFSYPGTSDWTRLDGAVWGESSISSGVAKLYLGWLLKFRG